MSFRFPCFLPFPPFRDSKANVSIVNPSTERLESFQWDHDHSEASRMCRKRDGTLRRRSQEYEIRLNRSKMNVSVPNRPEDM